MPMRRLIIGDIHARYEALRTVLEMASFDPDEDILYSTGDLCDRGREPVETLEFLSSLPGFRPVLGNHDIWLELFLLTGEVDFDWLYNGGVDTIRRLSSGLSKRRMEELGHWLSSFPVIRLEEDDIIVHGGPGPCRSMAEVERLAAQRRPSPFRIGNDDERILFGILWDRDYLFSAMESERYEVPSKYMKVHYDLTYAADRHGKSVHRAFIPPGRNRHRSWKRTGKAHAHGHGYTPDVAKRHWIATRHRRDEYSLTALAKSEEGRTLHHHVLRAQVQYLRRLQGIRVFAPVSMRLSADS